MGRKILNNIKLNQNLKDLDKLLDCGGNISSYEGIFENSKPIQIEIINNESNVLQVQLPCNEDQIKELCTIATTLNNNSNNNSNSSSNNNNNNSNNNVEATSTKRVLEIPSNQIKFKDSTWSHSLDTILDNCKPQFGISEKVQANFNKLIIYNSNNSISQLLQQDQNNNEDNIFGKLVIIIPTLNQNDNGGAQIKYSMVLNGDENKVQSVTSTSTTSTATSTNNQICLIYSLIKSFKRTLPPIDQVINNNSIDNSSSSSGGNGQSLEDELNKQLMDGKKLVYVLNYDNNYSRDRQILYQDLIGKDKLVFEKLLALKDKLKLSIYISNLNVKEEIVQIQQDEYGIKRQNVLESLFDQSDKEWKVEGIRVYDKKEVLPLDCFKNIKPYFQNQTNSERYYKVPSILIFKSDDLAGIIKSSLIERDENKINEIIKDLLLNQIENYSTSHHGEEGLEIIINYINNQNIVPTIPLSDNLLLKDIIEKHFPSQIENLDRINCRALLKFENEFFSYLPRTINYFTKNEIIDKMVSTNNINFNSIASKRKLMKLNEKIYNQIISLVECYNSNNNNNHNNNNSLNNSNNSINNNLNSSNNNINLNNSSSNNNNNNNNISLNNSSNNNNNNNNNNIVDLISLFVNNNLNYFIPKIQNNSDTNYNKLERILPTVIKCYPDLITSIKSIINSIVDNNSQKLSTDIYNQINRYCTMLGDQLKDEKVKLDFKKKREKDERKQIKLLKQLSPKKLTKKQQVEQQKLKQKLYEQQLEQLQQLKNQPLQQYINNHHIYQQQQQQLMQKHQPTPEQQQHTLALYHQHQQKQQLHQQQAQQQLNPQQQQTSQVFEQLKQQLVLPQVQTVQPPSTNQKNQSLKKQKQMQPIENPQIQQTAIQSQIQKAFVNKPQQTYSLSQSQSQLQHHQQQTQYHSQHQPQTLSPTQSLSPSHSSSPSHSPTYHHSYQYNQNQYNQNYNQNQQNQYQNQNYNNNNNNNNNHHHSNNNNHTHSQYNNNNNSNYHHHHQQQQQYNNDNYSHHHHNTQHHHQYNNQQQQQQQQQYNNGYQNGYDDDNYNDYNDNENDEDLKNRIQIHFNTLILVYRNLKINRSTLLEHLALLFGPSNASAYERMINDIPHQKISSLPFDFDLSSFLNKSLELKFELDNSK